MLLVLCSCSQNKAQLPAPAGWTNDYAHIFTAAQIQELDSIAGNFEKQTTIEIAIITLDSAQTNADEFEAFTLAVSKKWGVGKKDNNNGILIGISKQFKKIRINNGTGIEKILSDAETKKIIDEIIIPEYRQGDYFAGTKKGLAALMRKFR